MNVTKPQPSPVSAVPKDVDGKPHGGASAMTIMLIVTVSIVLAILIVVLIVVLVEPWPVAKGWSTTVNIVGRSSKDSLVLSPDSDSTAFARAFPLSSEFTRFSTQLRNESLRALSDSSSSSSSVGSSSHARDQRMVADQSSTGDWEMTCCWPLRSYWKDDQALREQFPTLNNILTICDEASEKGSNVSRTGDVADESGDRRHRAIDVQVTDKRKSLPRPSVRGVKKWLGDKIKEEAREYATKTLSGETTKRLLRAKTIVGCRVCALPVQHECRFDPNFGGVLNYLLPLFVDGQRSSPPNGALSGSNHRRHKMGNSGPVHGYDTALVLECKGKVVYQWKGASSTTAAPGNRVQSETRHQTYRPILFEGSTGPYRIYYTNRRRGDGIPEEEQQQLPCLFLWLQVAKRLPGVIGMMNSVVIKMMNRSKIQNKADEFRPVPMSRSSSR